MQKHPINHGSGDRNVDDVASRDQDTQRRRDKENREADKRSDRADESGTGNQEPPSPGSDH